MKTITMIGSLPPVKGISPYTLELCRELSKRVEVHFIGFKKIYPEFLYPGGTTDKSTGSFTIKNLKNRSFLTWYNPLTWIRAGLTTRGKLVHAQWWSHVLAPFYLVILSFCKIRGKKIILTVHNALPHEKSRINFFLNKSVLFFADALIVHSKENRKTLCDSYGIDPLKVHIIPHGILVPYRIRNLSKKQSRKKLGLDMEEKIILFFGNVRPYKGVDLLIKAYKELEIPGKKLIIAGKCWGSFPNYHRQIEKDDSIIFKDQFIPSDETEYYFKASDIIVLPYTHFDAASGVASLALPFHRPLVVSNVGSLPDYVIDKENCIFPKNNHIELKNRLNKILSDKRLQEKLSRDSFKKEKEFQWDVIVQKTISRVYEAISF